ncbi:MAG: hypothetical protein SFU91_12670 [Chloroherpetonaceae bacterium]|nr:hypothetical protein [Chloroherpetonaceae bacterium]
MPKLSIQQSFAKSLPVSKETAWYAIGSLYHQRIQAVRFNHHSEFTYSVSPKSVFYTQTNT